MAVNNSFAVQNGSAQTTNYAPANLKATIAQISVLANQDIEMLPPVVHGSTVLIIDTNILLHHLAILDNFVNVTDKFNLPIIILVPGAVVAELDAQKNRHHKDVSWFSRTASTWLLNKIRARRSVRGQTDRECVAPPPKNWGVAHEEGDYHILQCCKFFHDIGQSVVFLSGDKNLSINVAAQGIPTISPQPNWNGRALARDLFQHLGSQLVDLKHFSNFGGQVYTSETQVQDPRAQQDYDDENRMQVDQAEEFEAITVPDARNSLHLQVVRHFTALIIQLIAEYGADEIAELQRIPVTGLAASSHAPGWKKLRTPYVDWDVKQMLEFLNDHRPVRSANPSLSSFLREPYTGHLSKTGVEWSSASWAQALDELRRLGLMWEDDRIAQSLSELQPHLELVFGQKIIML